MMALFRDIARLLTGNSLSDYATEREDAREAVAKVLERRRAKVAMEAGLKAANRRLKETVAAIRKGEA